MRKDDRVPLVSKILLALAVGYTVLPIDLIPDFIPVFGQLDDLVIVPSLIILALILVPKHVRHEKWLLAAAVKP